MKLNKRHIDLMREFGLELTQDDSEMMISYLRRRFQRDVIITKKGFELTSKTPKTPETSETLH